ncbi:MAG: methylthioribulose 1-phosphate dehydratase [Xanthomonadales bacterium]|nr:methylthioribulose 1-phosphate dehydratase [Xanthomonadales bacterium]MCC6596313.1 methylthioribulose 1-phosphate dehydratase [Rhodanobacteraceae bacterium]MDL1869227.1 methylthioribulose 1-phosphate dehydratase [Gammaproteobacteria bacterium PRO6]
MRELHQTAPLWQRASQKPRRAPPRRGSVTLTGPAPRSTPIAAQIDRARLEACAHQIAAAGRALGALGWTPATSSNFSMRLDAQHAAVTISGRDKGQLGSDDIMVVDLDGRALDPQLRPSAETALHTQIYRRFAAAGAVLHTHSRAQSVASRLFAARGVVRFEGWELQKAIAGYSSHDSVLELPVFANSQDMAVLARAVDGWLDAGRPLHGYLIDGHGIYTWGKDMPEARRHLEALQFLLECELDLIRLRGTRP